MITRTAALRLAELAQLDPVVTVTGPRQSGKPTGSRPRRPSFARCSGPERTRGFSIAGSRPTSGWPTTSRPTSSATFATSSASPTSAALPTSSGSPAEVLKQSAHQGIQPNLFHYRDPTGLEVDLIADSPPNRVLTEAKSGATVAADFTASVERLAHRVGAKNPGRSIAARVIYGGDAAQTRGRTAVIPWHAIDQGEW